MQDPSLGVWCQQLHYRRRLPQAARLRDNFQIRLVRQQRLQSPPEKRVAIGQYNFVGTFCPCQGNFPS